MDDALFDLTRFLFVAYFGLAVLMWRADPFPGQRWMTAGFAAIGVPGLVYLLQPELSYDSAGLSNVLWIGGIGLLLIGAWQWSNAGIGGGSAGLRSTLAATLLGDQSTSNIPRTDESSVTKAEAVRDAIYQSLTTACQSASVEAAVFRSPAHGPQVWVRAEISVPDPQKPALSLRSSVRIDIHRHEFHRFERLLTVVLHDSRKSKTYYNVIELTPQQMLAIVQYLAGKRTSKAFGLERTRAFPFQLWRPRNRMQGIKRAVSFAGILAVAGIVLLVIPLVGVALLVVAAIVWLVERERARRVYSLTTGKPRQEPRILLRMDSWQTVVYGLAGHRDEVQDDLLRELRSQDQRLSTAEEVAGERVEVEEERVWYEGVDGSVERHQVAVRLGRAIAFVYVHPYGDDLYVGWDAHLNGGTWTERLLGEGVAAGTHRRARAYGIVQGWHTPHDHDIADASFLLEWVHARVTRVLRKALRAHEIDQEIDFKIVRESRQSLAGRENPQASKARSGGRFRRVG